MALQVEGRVTLDKPAYRAMIPPIQRAVVEIREKAGDLWMREKIDVSAAYLRGTTRLIGYQKYLSGSRRIVTFAS